MRILPQPESECAFVDHELDTRFGNTAASISERLRHHLGDCARCRRLYQWVLQPSNEPDASPDLYRNISRTLQTSATPVRALPSSRILVLQLAGVFLLLAALALAMAGVEGLRRMNLIQLSGIGAVLLSGAALVSLSLVWQMIPGSLNRYSARTVLPLVAAAFLIGIAVLFPWRAPEAFWSRGSHCLGLGLLMSAASALPFGLLVRRGAPEANAVMGATLGAFAGLLSVAVLQFSCAHQDLGHLFFWHGSVLAGSIVAGAAIAAAFRRLAA